VVAAEVNGELHLFLQWYKSNNPQPNITQLAMAGLPKGQGRKGGIPKQKHSRVFTAADVVVSRAATMQAHGVSSAFNTQSDTTAVSFPTEQTVSLPNEQCLSSGLPRPITTAATTTSVSAQVGNNFSFFSNSQIQSLIVNTSLGSMAQSQSG